MAEAPKIVPIGTKDDLQAGLESLRRGLPQLIEHAVMIAQFRRAFYLELVKQGFTEAQALDLCKHSITL